MGFHEAPTDLAALAPAFGSAQLFIDDCSDSDIYGRVPNNRGKRVTTGIHTTPRGMCWNYSLCQPCYPYGHECPHYCAGYYYWKATCNADFQRCNGTCSPGWNYMMPLFCS